MPASDGYWRAFERWWSPDAKAPSSVMGIHQSLKAWQHARVVAVECAKAAGSFPEHEQKALADQLRRAGYSAALNIAEGAARKGSRRYRRFLDVARASLHEVEAILDIAGDLGYLQEPALSRIRGRRDEAARTLYGLIRSLGPTGAKR